MTANDETDGRAHATLRRPAWVLLGVLALASVGAAAATLLVDTGHAWLWATAGIGAGVVISSAAFGRIQTRLDRQRTEALDRAEREERRGTAIAESMRDGLALVDADGTIIHANGPLAQITGWRSDALVDSPIPWANSVPSGFSGEMEISFERPDGETRDIGLTIRPTESEGGSVHILRDLTIGHTAEIELQNLATERDVLRRVATFVAGGAEPSAVFDLVACETATLLGAHACVVTRFERQTQRAVDVGVWADTVNPAGRPPSRVPMDGQSPTALVYQRGRAGRVDTFENTDARTAEVYVERGFMSAAAAPVVVGNVIWGAVAVLSREQAAFGEGVEDRLARFAELVGLTVANADAHARLASQAATDPLTGLANHRAFHDRLEAEVARAQHDQADLSLVIINLDNFKLVNDTFGHEIGDNVLAEAARRVAAEARFGEIVARIGGEEFAWILPGSDGINAWRAAERARRAVADSPFGHGVGNVTASAGVADLSQAPDVSTLIRLADGALYWAKVSGRDATFRYSPDVVREMSASERAERLAKTQAVTALRALARAVDAKDPSTARHAERVATMAMLLGRRLGWGPERIDLLREAALLHDVGKIGVPDKVLLKADDLTDEERKEVRNHAQLGAEIVSDVLTGEQVSWVRGHHERWDGTGYPDGLRGSDIPMGALIIAVADAWDAMTIARAYTTPYSASEAIHEITRRDGTQFCPAVVTALVRLWNDGALTEDKEQDATTADSAQR